MLGAGSWCSSRRSLQRSPPLLQIAAPGPFDIHPWLCIQTSNRSTKDELETSWKLDYTLNNFKQNQKWTTQVITFSIHLWADIPKHSGYYISTWETHRTYNIRKQSCYWHIVWNMNFMRESNKDGIHLNEHETVPNLCIQTHDDLKETEQNWNFQCDTH